MHILPPPSLYGCSLCCFTISPAWPSLAWFDSALSSAALSPTFMCASVMRNVITVVSQTQRKAKVDVAIWAGLVPENAHDPALLQGLLDHGALGFKSFLSPAGGRPTLFTLLLKLLLLLFQLRTLTLRLLLVMLLTLLLRLYLLLLSLLLLRNAAAAAAAEHLVDGGGCALAPAAAPAAAPAPALAPAPAPAPAAHTDVETLAAAA